jgi:uncharacterized membrane protein YgcG
VPLPRWRWLVYLAMAVAVFLLVFVKVGGSWPLDVFSLNAWMASTRGGELILITGVFGGLTMALLKLFLDPVFLGIAQRRSSLELAGELAATVAATGAGVAAEGLLSAAVSAASSGGGNSDGSAGGGISSGGGGSFGGGGATGKY